MVTRNEESAFRDGKRAADALVSIAASLASIAESLKPAISVVELEDPDEALRQRMAARGYDVDRIFGPKK